VKSGSAEGKPQVEGYAEEGVAASAELAAAGLAVLAGELTGLVGVVVISGRDFSISPEPQVSEGAGVAAGTSRSRFGHTGK
jgi:hypothetical protein